jgi:hypothetical protein
VIVGSDNSTRNLFSYMPRVSVSVFGEGKYEKTTGELVNTVPAKTDDQLLAELYDRTAQQTLDDADIDGDGLMSKDEYMAAQKRLADADNRIFDIDAAEERWSTFDPTGKGAIDKDEIIEGLKILLPLKVGHLDADMAERIRAQALEASKEALQNFQDAIDAESKKPAMAETIKTTIAGQASLLSLYDEYK